MIVSASGRPTASARDQPNVTSAWGFQSVILPQSSMATNASWASSTTRRARSFASWSASFTRCRSVLSRQTPRISTGRPSSSR